MIDIISTGSTLIIAAGIVLVFIKNVRKKISFAFFAVGFLLLSVAGLLKGYPAALAGLLPSAYATWNFIRFTDPIKTK
jgi:uncharacterized membrane protein